MKRPDPKDYYSEDYIGDSSDYGDVLEKYTDTVEINLARRLSEISQLKGELKTYKEALEKIKKHHEYIAPSSCHMSATYHITCKALKNG